MATMKAVAFRGVGTLAIEERPKPVPRAGQAVIRITTTTICGTDVHIVKGEYPVRPGLVLGHEPVGVIDALGEGLEPEYHVGQRVLVGAITPCGQCFYCLNAKHSQCGGPLGGWKFGNTIDGAWAEYLLVPDARANLAPIPAGLSDEDVMLCPDIFSTGLSGAESGNIRVGDAVAVFAQGPIGLCATLGAKLKGASLIVGIDSNSRRLEVARRFGATVTLNTEDGDPVPEIKRLTGGRGVDVAIEALGRQETFENALRAIRPGGTLSSLGVYSGKLQMPYDAFAAGLGDHVHEDPRLRNVRCAARLRHVDLRHIAHVPVTAGTGILDAVEDEAEVREPAARDRVALSGQADGGSYGHGAGHHARRHQRHVVGAP